MHCSNLVQVVFMTQIRLHLTGVRENPTLLVFVSAVRERWTGSTHSLN